MKKTRLLISIMLAVSLLGVLVPGVSAQGPVGTWASGITCVNLTGNIADIALEFFPEGSATSTLVYPDQIPANGTKGYYTPSSFGSGLGGAFTGSVVVSSSEPISCNVNTQTTGTGTTGSPYRIGTTSGFDAGAPVMYVPQVEKNYGGGVGSNWNSYIAVQNTGTAVMTATVTYKNNAGVDIPGATEAASIPAGSNKVFYQSANAGLPNNFVGSAKITASSGTLAAGAAFYNDGSSTTASQFHSFNAVSAGGDTLVLPRIVRKYYGYNSGVTIQNIGGSAIAAGTLSVTFTVNGSNYVVTRATQLDPGVSWLLYLPNVTELNPVDALDMTKRFGSAVVEAPGGSTIVAIVNEDNRGNSADASGTVIPEERKGQGSTYNAVPLGDADIDIFFPQVPRHAGGIFSGGFQISNATSSAGTCNITYGTTGVVENNVTLPASGSIARFAPNVAGLPNGYNASVSATCTQNVVGIANLAVNVPSGKLGDSFTQSTGMAP